MKVILIKDVRKLGKKGEIKEVKDGYGQNYLIKNGFAKPANDKNLNELKLLKHREAKQDQLNKEKALSDKEKLENLIKKIDELKEQIGIKKTIKDYGIEESKFLETLDEMTEQAFDDQCTGANPRYPLMSEIKQMYLNAYYGGAK